MLIFGTTTERLLFHLVRGLKKNKWNSVLYTQVNATIIYPL